MRTGFNKYHLSFVLALSGFLLPSMALSAPSRSELDQRLNALEIRVESNAIGIAKKSKENTAEVLATLVQRLDALEQENMELRNLIEETQNQLSIAQENQRQLSIDVDQKLVQLLESGESKDESHVKKTTQKAPKQSGRDTLVEERKLYEKAFGYLRTGKRDSAIKTFKQYGQKYPKGRFASNAQFWLSEAYYVKREFKTASENFKKLISHYPDSAKVPDAMLKLAYIELEQGKQSQAKKQLNQLIKQYPKSNAANLARKKIAILG